MQHLFSDILLDAFPLHSLLDIIDITCSRFLEVVCGAWWNLFYRKNLWIH